MRCFIKNALVNTRNKNMKTFDYQYKNDNGDTITVKGIVENSNATFTISRTKADGHNCCNIPVMEMPLTDNCISQIVELAVENL